tara:strand:+ start:64 stop:270 length:207 start_codon:yes stop_codon:yes gene_type:complete
VGFVSERLTFQGILKTAPLSQNGSNSQGESESEPNIEKYAFAAAQRRMSSESKICGIIKNPLIFVNFS